MAASVPAPVATSQKAAKGSQVPFFFAIKKPTEIPADGDWYRGGFKRGFESSDSNDTIDVTGDMSPGRYKESISGFMESTVSIDFIARLEDTANQKLLWKHLKKPDSITDFEPTVWICWFHPVFNLKIVQCFTKTSLSDSMQYDDAVTFSAEFNALGEPDITEVTP